MIARNNAVDKLHISLEVTSTSVHLGFTFGRSRECGVIVYANELLEFLSTLLK